MEPRKTTILLRNEYKPGEHRTAITPSDMKSLLPYYRFYVESSSTRIYSNEEYKSAGATIVPEGTWATLHLDHSECDEHSCKNEDDYSHLKVDYVLGLKELPDPGTIMKHSFGTTPDAEVTTPFALNQRHIMFAHCFKYQNNWKETLQRFQEGKGELLDLEFLQWDNGRRVAAFGKAAGFAGMAVGLLGYAAQDRAECGPVDPENSIPLDLNWYKNNDDLVDEVKRALAKVGEIPTVLILGALGRCGSGAVEMARKAGIPEDHIIQWDLAETKKGGPFPELLHMPNILVNCIYVNSKMPAFIDHALLEENPSRKLSIFVDVSCEMSENNPFPINNSITTFPKPFRRIASATENAPPLDCCAIDHLPAMIPRESSEDFSRDLLAALKSLNRIETTHDVDIIEKHLQTDDEEHASERVWYRAKKLFNKKLDELNGESTAN